MHPDALVHGISDSIYGEFHQNPIAKFEAERVAVSMPDEISPEFRLKIPHPSFQ